MTLPASRLPAGGAADPTIAIAFGGGGARGLVHIHVVEALDELGLRPVSIAGSSIGALMGAGMAAGMTGREIHEYARAILGRRAEVASRIWQARPSNIKEMVAGGFQVGQFNVERILRAFLPPAIPATFEELSVPLKVTATDFFRQELVVFESGELLPALAASAAIPAVFRPIRIGERVLVDGGIYNPVPFDLISGDADITIAIDVVGAPTRFGSKMPSSVDLMFGTTQLMMQSINEMKLRSCRPDILLKPPVSRFRVLDFMKVETVLAETAGIKDDLKRALQAAFERREGLLRSASL